MAEDQWYEACANNNYSWHGQIETSDISEPRHPQYFHYWFERKRLDKQDNVPDDEGQANPPLPVDKKHALSWKKVVAREKGALSKATKKQLLVLYEEALQQIEAVEDLSVKYKSDTADEKQEKDRIQRKFQAEKKKLKRQIETERKQHHNVTKGIKADNKYLLKNLRTIEGSSQAAEIMQRQRAQSQTDLDEQQNLIQTNYIQALEGKFDIDEKLEENRELKLKLSRAEDKIAALERANEEIGEKEGGSRKRKYEELSSENKQAELSSGNEQEDLSSDRESLDLDEEDFVSMRFRSRRSLAH